jgi:hypothetical protein
MFVIRVVRKEDDYAALVNEVEFIGDSPDEALGLCIRKLAATHGPMISVEVIPMQPRPIPNSHL